MSNLISALDSIHESSFSIVRQIAGNGRVPINNCYSISLDAIFLLKVLNKEGVVEFNESTIDQLQAVINEMRQSNEARHYERQATKRRASEKGVQTTNQEGA